MILALRRPSKRLVGKGGGKGKGTAPKGKGWSDSGKSDYGPSAGPATNGGKGKGMAENGSSSDHQSTASGPSAERGPLLPPVSSVLTKKASRKNNFKSQSEKWIT